jgi:transposase
MQQLVSASSPSVSFGALLRARRHQACLSQEQLAERAELSERTVRNLEAGQVRSPRTDTVRLLADALELSEPEREDWFEAARGVNHQRGAPGPVHVPNDAPAGLPLNECGFGGGNNHRRYRSLAGEYMAEIVELCQRDGGSTGQLARDFDVSNPAARAWVGQPGWDARNRSDGGLTSADQQELARLRRENRRLREDLEILKRAAAIFAAAAR